MKPQQKKKNYRRRNNVSFVLFVRRLNPCLYSIFVNPCVIFTTTNDLTSNIQYNLIKKKKCLILNQSALLMDKMTFQLLNRAFRV